MSEKNNYEMAADDLEKREYKPQVQPEFNEQSERPTSLGKAESFNKNNHNQEEPNLLPGYHEIYAQNFPSKGLFYPEGSRFFIRAAEVNEIRNFSTLNEKDPYSVDEALNEIVKSCLMIRFGGGKVASYKDLREEDRIHVIFTIRELTFVNGENKIGVKLTCEECNHENEIEVTNSSFETNLLGDQIMKYYDSQRRIFIVNTKSGSIEIVPPSIGTMNTVTKWIRTKKEEGKKIDPSFAKALPYLITDWRKLTDGNISNLEVEFKQWNTQKYITFNGLTEMVKIGVKEEMHKLCDKCGVELRTPITFPGGIKNLFVISDITGQLL